ncbi:MAG TPA: hypothetical protein VHX88_10355 [Solirubrobacteraceae bacterium]|jgi:hypothetical protein|nr:hypothetical protein [Solirubrobacteraceae bacterium]
MPERKPKTKTPSKGGNKARRGGRPSAAGDDRGARRRTARDPASAALTLLRDGLERTVVITTDRLQQTIDDAVRRGRITRDDGEDIIARLMSGGRRQSDDLLGDIERALGRGRSGVASAVRRVAGAPGLPIDGYDELTAATISARLGELDASGLRRIRDYEQRHGNRKSVLDAVDRRLRRLD